MPANRSVLLLTVCALLFALGSPVFAQLDPAAPPTDDLDYAEIQLRIAAMLPAQPDLLKFSPLYTFRFVDWPDGIGNLAARYEEAFKGYSLKTSNNKVLLLDKSGRTIFACDSEKKRQTMLATDYQNKGLQLDDFAPMHKNGLAIADNSKNALLFFEDNKFVRQVGFDGNRILFRHISFVEPDRLGLNVAVYDSGRDKTFVFDASGRQQWELAGTAEPCFFGNSLLRLVKHDTKLEIQRFSDILKTPDNIGNYSCSQGNIILDAWIAGTFGGQLAMVVYEGRGDEDHPDYARLLLLKDRQIKTHRFIPNLDSRLSLVTPYRLLITRSGVQLISARITGQGLEIVAAPVPYR